MEPYFSDELFQKTIAVGTLSFLMAGLLGCLLGWILSLENLKVFHNLVGTIVGIPVVICIASIAFLIVLIVAEIGYSCVRIILH